MRMRYRVLLISSGDKFSSAMNDILGGGLDVDTTEPHSARDAIAGGSYDLVFVNTHARALEDAQRIAVYATRTGAVALLLVPSECYDSSIGAMTPNGVFVLAKPAQAAALTCAIEFMKAARERLRTAERRAGIVEEKIADMQLLNRAKWILIDNLQMTEAEAHRYIERQAMDRCEPKRAIAESIINTYKTI